MLAHFLALVADSRLIFIRTLSGRSVFGPAWPCKHRGINHSEESSSIQAIGSFLFPSSHGDHG